MALIEWNTQLTLGINSIDTQHKLLVKYINDLHDAMLDGKGNDILGGILKSLVDYTVRHFDYEENLLAKHGYPDTPAHKEEHVKLCDTVLAFKEKFDAGEATVSADIMDFLKDWLMNHILKTDKQYVSFLNENGVS